MNDDAPPPPTPKAANHNKRRSVFRSIRMSMSISSNHSTTNSASPPPPVPPLPAGLSSSPSQRPPPALPTRPAHQHPLPPPTSSETGSVSSHRTPSPAGGPVITQQHAAGSTTSSFGNKLGLRRLLKGSKGQSSGSYGGGAQTDFECDDVGVMQQHGSSSLSRRTQANHQFPSMKSAPPPLPLPTDSPPSASRGGWQTDVEGKGSKSGKVAPRLRIESKLQAFTAGLRRHHNMLSNPPQAQMQSPLSPSRPAPPPKPVDLRSPTSRQNLRPPVPPPQGVVDDRDEEDKDAGNPPPTPRSFDSHRSGGPNRPLTPTMIAAQNVAAASALMPNKHQQHGQSLSPTPATTAVAVPSSTTSGIKAIIAPPLPARKKHGARPDNSKSGYGSGGESSSTEPGATPKGSGSVLKNNIKGRLAAWTAANASNPNQHSARQGGAPGRLPPSAYNLQSSSPSTTTSSSPATPSSALPNQNDPYGRGRSNTHAATSNTVVPSTPNPKRMTATMGNIRLTPQHPSQTSLHSNVSSSTGATPASFVANVAVNTAGSIGAAAGGMAMQLGRKVGNFLGHRAGGGNSQSGNWGGLTGYMTAGEDGGAGFGFHPYNPRERESHDGGTGAMSDSGHGGHNGHSNKVLGTLVRPPLRKAKGVVFKRPLRECVEETRVSAGLVVDEEPEPERGNGVYVTALVTRCIEHLTQWGLEEEGLFRITGRSTHVARIRNEFDTGADYLLKEAHPSDLDPHAVSSIFKAYLRELPEPILTKELSPQFDLAMLLGTGEEATPGTRVTAFGGGFSGLGDNSSFDSPTMEAMVELKNLMGRLPRENYDLLYEICKLLRSTARCSKATKMPLSNLLLVFCPSLQLSPGFLKLVIEKQDYLFGNGDVGSVSPSRAVEADKPKSGSAVRGPTLPQRPGADDSKRNRTASILLPQGFAFTVEAYPESLSTDPTSQPQPQPQSQLQPTPQVPSRPITPVGYNNTFGQPPGTPSSISSHSMHRVQLPPNFGQGGSARARQASSAKRQPSLASLFTGGGNKSTPTISSPIPIVPRSETPSEPPKLDIELPTGSLTVGGNFGSLNDRQSTPTTPPTATSSQSPLTSDSENFKLTSTTPAKDISVVPRPAATPLLLSHSPPPQIPVLGAPPRASGDDWATSVLMAAGGAK
ncbi:hypothetical protein FRC01_005421 [Tulasnella sp. 417]|nr:hypothetical protein FRC01_005421 [Tulasnella sp. 417]